MSKVYIESLFQVRRELAKTYDIYKKKEINSDVAKTRVTILRAIMEANFKYDIEQRIIELEKRLSI